MAHSTLLESVPPVALTRFDEVWLLRGVDGVPIACQHCYPRNSFARHEAIQNDAPRYWRLGRVDYPHGQGLAILASRGSGVERGIGALDFRLHAQGQVVAGDHLRHVIRRLSPHLRRRKEEQALIPVVVILLVRLETVGRAGDGNPGTQSLKLVDGAGIGQRPLQRMIARIELEHDYLVFRARTDPA